jgi:hypothetical protein
VKREWFCDGPVDYESSVDVVNGNRKWVEFMTVNVAENGLLGSAGSLGLMLTLGIKVMAPAMPPTSVANPRTPVMSQPDLFGRLSGCIDSAITKGLPFLWSKRSGSEVQ